MELVYSWLRDYVDITVPLIEVGQALTMLGMEVEDVRLVGLPEPHVDGSGITFHGLAWDRDKIVVARVDEVMPHPNADRLVLCRLFDGQVEHTVLTGAPNLYDYKGKGPLQQLLMVAYAKEGARIYDGHAPGQVLTTLKRMKIRGVDSYSMICSEKELGISEEHEGVIILDPDAPVGIPLADYLGDAVFSLSIMPNMIHCASVIGIAREVAAYFDLPFKMPATDLSGGTPSIKGKVSLDIRDPELNPRFVLGLISGVRFQPSPYKVQYRLKLAGMRPISAVVDATNYVMMESGEPLHAFDYDVLVARAKGSAPTIITRTAEKGETLTTLDGVDHALDNFTELVCDTAGALSIAGVMGGLESEVTDATQNVLLEGASWNFINIRKTVASQRMHSEAAYRFARNVHPALAETGVRLGLLRMAAWSGGQIADGLVDAYPDRYQDPVVKLTESDVTRMLGIQLKVDEIAGLLERLGYQCNINGDALEANAPPYRTDIGEGLVGQADVIEDVARLYGYARIPATRMRDELPPQRANPAEERDRTFQDILVSLGLQEIASYRLTSPESELRLYPEDVKPELTEYVALKNPISEDRRVLRTSLLASVLDAMARNIRMSDRLALFEIGPVFLPQREQLLPQEPQRLAIAISGLRYLAAWDSASDEKMDFFDLKGILESLLASLHIVEYRFEPAQHPTWHPGKCAQMIVSGEAVGWMGELHPEVAKQFGLAGSPALAADLDMEALFRLKPDRFESAPIPAYPPVIEDLAVIVPESMQAAAVAEVMQTAGGFLHKSVDLFDIFRSEQIGLGNKSMAFRLTYQAPNRTLNDQEVGKLRSRIIQALEKELKAKVRKPED